ncbi:helix-turn-helix domain-containing protein [Agrobacterium rubi]|uniref:Helix-turn-helix domain-containing protein n=1 Tax=Agrobacterium rubi TaxID=28099 RepID=A0AAE7UPK6_9HYPH|nr:helix-turn-helix transcriptional regulator [Agrobacterium rubi]NTE86589.1 helix-turn-helix domain-containing protein [Agrobacterium rubi]NTF02521.1 helix-turn-helix domain-containing protein [Agrobacterium rubi]NTF36766.1 helix-turn-helix domain-containing protein [Agrobacterium rubi]OCJ55615.1 hypothetical protein A6U92_03255 [Agrobacterium rubi]QTF99215.1 helix-turn-helix domain-containing protein [Agrobacterium rubi]
MNVLSCEQKLKQLGSMIERARRSKRLTTYQTAQCVGISTSELNSVESGEKWPSDYAWEKLCETFGFPIDMMAAMKKERQPIAVQKPALQESKREIVKASNVINLAAHKQKKWQQTFSFEKD